MSTSSKLDTIRIIPSEKNQELEVHFNFWDSDANRLHCLDVGVKSKLFSNDGFIQFIIPGDVSDSVENLADVISKNVNIARNIFNESVSVDNNSGPNNANKTIVTLKKVKNDGSLEEEKFYLYLGTLSGIKDQTKNVTIVTLPIKRADYPNHDVIYFRFRLMNVSKDYFASSERSLARFFVPYCEVSTIFDFRINDIKLLENQECQNIADQNVRFGKIHFLLINDVGESVCLHNGFVKVRVFENQNWGAYIKSQKDTLKPMLAYHVSEKKEKPDDLGFPSASFLLKVHANKTNFIQIILYTGMVVAITLLGNFVYSSGYAGIIEVLKNIVNYCKG